MGCSQGGPSGFGLRRVLVNERGELKGELKPGEHKSLQTDRVILMPGLEEEIAWANCMFRWLIDESMSFREITDRLNEHGIATDLERPWTPTSVRTVLTNEKYIGNNVFNRRSFKLKRHHVDNPAEMWIRKEGAFEAIVPIEIFMMAQEIITARFAKISNEELLEDLKRLYAEHGQIDGVLIDQSDALPSASVYRTRFGSVRRAYALIGYQTNFDHERVEINARLRAMYPEIVQDTLTQIDAIGGAVVQAQDTGLLNINNELVVSLVLSRCRHPEMAGFDGVCALILSASTQTSHWWCASITTMKLRSIITCCLG